MLRPSLSSGLVFLGSDDDHSVGATHAVRRRGDGVAQDLHRLDIVDVDRREIVGQRGTKRNAVHDEQGFVIADDCVPPANHEFGMTVLGSLNRETRYAREQQLLE